MMFNYKEHSLQPDAGDVARTNLVLHNDLSGTQ
jgi:hypothetical protein